VLRTGRPEFYAEVTGEMVEAAAIDEEHLRILREIGPGRGPRRELGGTLSGP
jgi:hypothetical protein